MIPITAALRPYYQYINFSASIAQVPAINNNDSNFTYDKTAMTYNSSR